MIPFIQYKMPHGHKVLVDITRPELIETMAKRLLDFGARFEIEMLSTGEVSMECVMGAEDSTLAIELCPNGPEVPKAVDRLVDAAFQACFNSTANHG